MKGSERIKFLLSLSIATIIFVTILLLLCSFSTATNTTLVNGSMVNEFGYEVVCWDEVLFWLGSENEGLRVLGSLWVELWHLEEKR